jgi:hypothetical protein
MGDGKQSQGHPLPAEGPLGQPVLPGDEVGDCTEKRGRQAGSDAEWKVIHRRAASCREIRGVASPRSFSVWQTSKKGDSQRGFGTLPAIAVGMTATTVSGRGSPAMEIGRRGLN